MMESTGKSLRLGRLFQDEKSPLFVVPLDHTVTDGPFTDNNGYATLLEAMACNGVDAVVVHKGRMRQISRDAYARLSWIVHISASTRYAPEPNHKYKVGEVEDCLRRGADAISVHVNLGASTEGQQIAVLAGVADDCDRLGVPLLAMLYPRGLGVQGHAPADTLAHAAALAVDIGADIVKLPLSGSAGEMRDVIRSCPIPVLAAGGSLVSDDDFNAFVANVVRCGARGLAAGRNIFMASDPAARVRDVRKILHLNQPPLRSAAA